MAVAELIQATQLALGRASEALARIFLSLEASGVPDLADRFVAFLRSKGLSRQRLSRIRIAAGVRAELQASSRLDMETTRVLLALGDDLLDAYQRLSEASQARAHSIIKEAGRISRQQLRQLQAEPVSPFRVSHEPVQVDRRTPTTAEPGLESTSGLVSAPELVPVSEADPIPVYEPLSDRDPVPTFSPIRGVDDIRDRIRTVGLNEYQILAAALDVLEKREVNIFYPHTREQLDRLENIINTLFRDYWHKTH